MRRTGLAMLAGLLLCGCYDFSSFGACYHSTAPQCLAPGAQDAGAFCSGLPGTGCAQGSYLFCDGFEDSSGATLPHWSGANVSSGAGTALLAVDAGVPACRGGHVLSSSAGCCDQYAVAFKDLALPDPVYVRTFMYVPASAHVGYVDALGFSDASDSFTLGVRFADVQLGRLVAHRSFPPAPPTDLGPVSAGLSADRWICLETAVHFDPAAGWVKLWVDGAQVADFEATATLPAGATADSVRLGVERTPSNQSGLAQVYYDELVISAQPIGCQ